MKRCTRRCSSVLIRDRSVHRQLVHRQRLNPMSRPSKPFPQRCPITIRSKTNHSAILRLLKTTAGPTSLLSTAGLLRSALMATSGKHSVRSAVPMTARLCDIRSTAAAVLVPDTKLPHPPPQSPPTPEGQFPKFVFFSRWFPLSSVLVCCNDPIFTFALAIFPQTPSFFPSCYQVAGSLDQVVDVDVRLLLKMSMLPRVERDATTLERKKYRESKNDRCLPTPVPRCTALVIARSPCTTTFIFQSLFIYIWVETIQS